MYREDKTKMDFLVVGTWVVASQTRRAAKHLPEEGGVFVPVLFKHLL